MAKSEILKLAHSEAAKIVAKQGISYREALVFGLRRAHNEALKARNVAILMARTGAPRFMWLRGW